MTIDPLLRKRTSTHMLNALHMILGSHLPKSLGPGQKSLRKTFNNIKGMFCATPPTHDKTKTTT